MKMVLAGLALLAVSFAGCNGPCAGPFQAEWLQPELAEAFRGSEQFDVSLADYPGGPWPGFAVAPEVAAKLPEGTRIEFMQVQSEDIHLQFRGYEDLEVVFSPQTAMTAEEAQGRLQDLFEELTGEPLVSVAAALVEKWANGEYAKSQMPAANGVGLPILGANITAVHRFEGSYRFEGGRLEAGAWAFDLSFAIYGVSTADGAYFGEFNAIGMVRGPSIRAQEELSDVAVQEATQARFAELALPAPVFADFRVEDMGLCGHY